MIKKFPSVWEKCQKNRKGGIFLTHTVGLTSIVGRLGPGAR